jgi:hypothetical protein
MKSFVIPATLAIFVALVLPATAQDSRPHFRRSVEATVDAVDTPTRILELKRPEGYYVRLHVPESFTTLDSLKVGQTVTATYNETVILKLQKTGAQAHSREPVTPPKTAAEAHSSPDLQRVVTATISAVDTKLGNISFTEDNGRIYSARTEKPDLAKKVKVGDKMDIVYTQATLVDLK